MQFDCCGLAWSVILTWSGIISVYGSWSFSLANAFLAIVWNACSTFKASLALVSKYGILFFSWHHCWALLEVI